MGDFTSTLLTALVVAAGYLPVVSLLTEGVVTERVTKLRNVLTVAGCDVSSYWLGQLVGDFTLLLVPAALTSLFAVAVAHSAPFPSGDDRADDGVLLPTVQGGALFWVLAAASAQLCGFCYFCSFWFPSAKFAIAFMPFFCIVMIFLPTIFVGLFWFGLGPQGADVISFSGNAIFENMVRPVLVCNAFAYFVVVVVCLGRGGRGLVSTYAARWQNGLLFFDIVPNPRGTFRWRFVCSAVARHCGLLAAGLPRDGPPSHRRRVPGPGPQR